MCGLYFHSEHKGKYRNYHYEKYKIAKEKGVTLITIFDDQWSDKTHIVKSRISSVLGVISKKIFARNCVLNEVSSADAKMFLNQNHLQSWCASKHQYGLFHNHQLIALMTFGKSRFDSNEYELLRYCTLADTTVVGGASKLFSHFVNIFKPKTITSYSDNCWGFSRLYQNLGFVHEGTTSPGYFYYPSGKNILDFKINGHRVSRNQTQKHKLVKKLPELSNLSESEIMKMHQYHKIWDCGNEKWIWNSTV